jgi:hypothetical protein
MHIERMYPFFVSCRWSGRLSLMLNIFGSPAESTGEVNAVFVMLSMKLSMKLMLCQCFFKKALMEGRQACKSIAYILFFALASAHDKLGSFQPRGNTSQQKIPSAECTVERTGKPPVNWKSDFSRCSAQSRILSH